MRDGAVRHVRGDRDHHISRGRLCRKCTTAYNGAFIDPGARLLAPLLRTGPKESGAFREVSWEVALERIAGELSAITAGPGAATILAAHYTGTFAQLGYGFPSRFIRRLGATEVDPDTICNKAGHVALDYLFGTSADGFDPRTATEAACVLVWGANPSASGPHQHEQWLAEAPGHVVVVDPIATETARAADLHLQPFPGSDAALAFAMAHVLRRDGLLDADVLARCIGWDELEPLLEECTPEWGARVTGVPARAIEQAASWYGAGPSLLWIGQGFQRQPRGGNAVRAVGQLAALSGNLGRPGAGVLYLNGGGNRLIDEDYVSGARLPWAAPEPISHMDLLDHLEDPARSRAFLCWNINPAASNPQQSRLRRALAREDLFTVAIDIFPTDTTDLADVVLPAASFLEHDDLVVPYFDLTLSAQVKAVEPFGQALPNTEIFRRLAAAMGFTEPELFEADADIIDHLLAGSGARVDFAALAEAGTVFPLPSPRVQFEDLAFPTPSGRIELASAAAERDGHPRVAQPWADPRPASGCLRLLSPASAWTLNDMFANEPKLAARLGAATITLHPDDAATRGLRSGDRAVVANSVGSLELDVAVSDIVPPGVALCPKGRWPKLEPARANVNALNPGAPSDMGASSSVHGVEVTVSRAEDR